MAYCVLADIEAVYGVTNVKLWSNLEQVSDTVDEARVGRAILFASAWLDACLTGGIYQVPVVPINESAELLLTDLCARVAGHWLRRSREHDESVSMSAKLDEEIEARVGAIRSGQLQPAWRRSVDRSVGPRVV